MSPSSAQSGESSFINLQQKSNHMNVQKKPYTSTSRDGLKMHTSIEKWTTPLNSWQKIVKNHCKLNPSLHWLKSSPLGILKIPSRGLMKFGFLDEEYDHIISFLAKN